MAGLNLNFGTSVIKREAKPASRVRASLERDGWTEISEVAGGRIAYYERSNINITVVDGPAGTVIMPSGPIRGRVFGNMELFSRDSVLGLSSSTNMSNEQAQSQMKGSRRTGSRTLL